MLMKKYLTGLFVFIVIVSCSKGYQSAYTYKKAMQIDRDLIYVFEEGEKKDSNTYYFLIGTELGTQILSQCIIKKGILVKENVYMIKFPRWKYNNGVLHDNILSGVIPLFSVSYDCDSCSVAYSQDNSVSGTIIKNKSMLKVKFDKEKHTRKAKLVYFNKLKDKQNENSVLVYSDNKIFWHISFFYSLLGSNIFVLTQISSSVTDVSTMYLDDSNNLKPLYDVRYSSSHRDWKELFLGVSGKRYVDTLGIEIWSNLRKPEPPDYIIKTGNSLKFFFGGFPLEKKDSLEKYLLDYDKVRPFYHKTPAKTVNSNSNAPRVKRDTSQKEIRDSIQIEIRDSIPDFILLPRTRQVKKKS